MSVAYFSPVCIILNINMVFLLSEHPENKHTVDLESAKPHCTLSIVQGNGMLMAR